MKHSVPHDLDAETARRVADKAWESYSERFGKYDPTIQWRNDREAEIGFKAKGIKLKGTLELAARSIDMDLDVPFLLRPFKKVAIDVIEKEIERWIAKAKAGEI